MVKSVSDQLTHQESAAAYINQIFLVRLVFGGLQGIAGHRVGLAPQSVTAPHLCQLVLFQGPGYVGFGEIVTGGAGEKPQNGIELLVVHEAQHKMKPSLVQPLHFLHVDTQTRLVVGCIANDQGLPLKDEPPASKAGDT